MYWFDMWNAVLGIRVKIGGVVCVEIEIRWATPTGICKNERRDQLDLESRTKVSFGLSHLELTILRFDYPEIELDFEGSMSSFDFDFEIITEK